MLLNVSFYVRIKISEEPKRGRIMRVLILSCGTGGGHNSAALAIQENLQENGVEADFIEYLSIINPKIKNRVNRAYICSTKRNGKVFKVVYRLGELYQKTKWKSPVYTINSLNKEKLYQYIVNNQYDYVVTTHLFAAEALTAIKKEHPIHFMAVATDYVSIPFWEETNPDYFVIPQKELEQDFISRRIDKNKLLPYGIPVAKSYRQEYDKNKCKKSLGLDENKKYVLILTGSMGFGNVTQMIEALLKQIRDVTFIVSCGHNEKLLQNLQEMRKQNENIIPLPFTNQLSDYMKSCEIILSKPGGLTTTEMATLHKPFIHTMPIPGCENYNAEFFSKRKMSIKCNTIEDVVKNTKVLLENTELQKEMIENQSKYMNRNVCDDIYQKIVEECKG